jgi:hypothetical protein
MGRFVVALPLILLLMFTACFSPQPPPTHIDGVRSVRADVRGIT